MEAINKAEKSKKVWQFLVFFSLPLIVFGTMLYAYQNLPVKLMEDDLKNVELSSKYSQIQILYSKDITSMDSMFQAIRKINDPNKQQELVSQLTRNIMELQGKDSSAFISSIGKMVNHHIEHLSAYYNIKADLEKAKNDSIKKENEKQLQQNMMQQSMDPNAGAMPAGENGSSVPTNW